MGRGGGKVVQEEGLKGLGLLNVVFVTVLRVKLVCDSENAPNLVPKYLQYN